MAKNDVHWLLARPIAHRGFHDLGNGRAENTLPAVQAAIDADYAIEVDLQLSRDGVPIVFHDYGLERLTGQPGKVAHQAAHELTRLPVLNTTATIPLLTDLIDMVDGRVPLLIELKTQGPRNEELVTAVHKAIARYKGPLALQSFDAQMIFQSRKIDPALPFGALSPVTYPKGQATLVERTLVAMIANAYLHWPWTQPDFIGHHAEHLPGFWPMRASKLFGVPLLSWTVRSKEEAKRLEPIVDQIIFEAFAA